jgi:hypothetical protein
LVFAKNTKRGASQLVFGPLIGSFGQKGHEWRDFVDERRGVLGDWRFLCLLLKWLYSSTKGFVQMAKGYF